MKRRVWMPLLASSLAGCGGLLPKPPAPPSRYALDDGAAVQSGPTAAAGAPVLLVAQARAAAGFDTAQMRHLGATMALQAYTQSEWVAPPAEMLAPLLVQALQRSGAFRAVLLAPSSARADLRLETELIRLQQDFRRRPSELQLTLRVLLIDLGTRRALGTRSFEQRLPAVSEDALGGVLAARQASSQVLRELADFCAELVLKR
jgi:cholesterol transport system auxiliary component